MGRPIEPRNAGYLRRPLDRIFALGGNIAVLRALTRVADGATGREIARLAGIAPQAAHDALARLEVSGIVRRSIAGRSHVFRLNGEHFLVKGALLPLLETERQFRDRLKRALRDALAHRILAGAIFGSMARGGEEAESDFDVCLIVEVESQKEAASEAAGRIFDRIRKEFGLLLSPIVFAKREFAVGYRDAQALFRNIARDAESFYGPDLAEVTLGKKDEANKDRAGNGGELRRRRR